MSEEKIEALRQQVAALEAMVTELPEAPMVRTQSLQIVDEAGTVRASIATRDGTVRFMQTDANGKLRVGMAVGAQGRPALVFFDERSAARIELGLGDEDRPSLTLADERESPRVTTGIQPGGHGGIWAYDAECKLRAALGSSAEGKGIIGTFNEESR